MDDFGAALAGPPSDTRTDTLERACHIANWSPPTEFDTVDKWRVADEADWRCLAETREFRRYRCVTMQVFAVFDVSDPDPVREKIKARYGDNCYETGRNSFFVATEGETTRQLASAIGLGDESASSGIVIPVTSYWGRHDSQLWEWIGVKLNTNGG